jgi:hypothetical protein
MSVSAVKPGGHAARLAIFLLLSLVCAAPLRAADGPVPLLPKAGAPSPAEPAVHSVELAPASLEGVGTLIESQGGFSNDMWAGSNRAAIERLIGELPAALPSRTLRQMERRLLLTAADLPDGSKEAERGQLIAARVERLAAMGDIDGVLGLMRVVPSRLVSESMLRAKAEAHLLAGEDQAVCREQASPPPGARDPFWTKFGIFCKLLAGDKAKASLGLDILRDLRHDDPAFLMLAEALLGLNPPNPPSMADAQPLHVAMLRAAKRPAPLDAARASHPGVLRLMALTPSLDGDLRLAAAERAEIMGVLDTEALRRLYSAVAFNDQEKAQALMLAEKDRGVRGRALLWQAAKASNQSDQRAEIIAKSLALAGPGYPFLAMSRLMEPLILEMSPSSSLIWFAPTALRALYAAGRYETARQWSEALLRGKGMEDRATQTSLAPLIRLADPRDGDNWNETALSSWRQLQLSAKDKASTDLVNARAALLFGLIEALGDSAGAAWIPLQEGSKLVPMPQPRPALWHALRQASEQLRLGETVLASLVTLGENGAASDAISLYRAVAALKLIGLEREARSLAVEAAILAGL